jgi:hypothetical protein
MSEYDLYTTVEEIYREAEEAPDLNEIFSQFNRYRGRLHDVLRLILWELTDVNDDIEHYRDGDIIAAKIEEVRQLLAGLANNYRVSKPAFRVGQRVVLKYAGGVEEIGTVVPSETGVTNGVWVYSPTKKYACDYALHNVYLLPNGQL